MMDAGRLGISRKYNVWLECHVVAPVQVMIVVHGSHQLPGRAQFLEPLFGACFNLIAHILRVGSI